MWVQGIYHLRPKAQWTQLTKLLSQESSYPAGQGDTAMLPGLPDKHQLEELTGTDDTSGFSASLVAPTPRHVAFHGPPVLPLWFPCVLMSFLVVMSCSPPNPSPTSPLSPSWPMFSAPSSPMPTSSTSSDSSPIRSVAGFVWFSVAAVVLSLAWSSLHAVFSLLVNFVPCHPNLHLLFDRPEEAVHEDSR